MKSNVDFIADKNFKEIEANVLSVVIPEGMREKAAGQSTLKSMADELKEKGEFPHQMSLYERLDGRWEIGNSPSDINWILAAKQAGVDKITYRVGFYTDRSKVKREA